MPIAGAVHRALALAVALASSHAPRIDAHVHFGGDASLAQLVATMDRTGTARAILLAGPSALQGDPADNDALLAAAAKHPDRFVPFVAIDLARTDAASLRALLDRGACGVKLYQGHSDFHRRRLDAPEHEAAWTALEAMQVPVKRKRDGSRVMIARIRSCSASRWVYPSLALSRLPWLVSWSLVGVMFCAWASGCGPADPRVSLEHRASVPRIEQTPTASSNPPSDDGSSEPPATEPPESKPQGLQAIQTGPDASAARGCIDDAYEPNDSAAAAKTVPFSYVWDGGEADVNVPLTLCFGHDDWFRIPSASLKFRPKMLKLRLLAAGHSYCLDPACGYSFLPTPGPEHTVRVEVVTGTDLSLIGGLDSDVGDGFSNMVDDRLGDDFLIHVWGPPEATYGYTLQFYLQSSLGEDECEC